MKRIDTADRAVDLFGAGKDGFREQVLGVSQATQLTAQWFNMVQEGLVRTIEAAGITLSAADYDQFTAAVQALAAAAASSKVTQGGGAGQIAGIVKIGNAAGGKLKAEVDGVDLGNVAFESWVQAQVAALVNSSPTALDTLKELADALGDDANFAATMTAALANKERKFDSGTRMLFQQSAAPVGWTKVTSYDNAALRVVSGAAGSGGTVGFNAAFVNGTVGNTALTIAQIPSHDHGTPVTARDGSTAAVGDGGGTSTYPGVRSGATGGGLPHTHTLNLDVQYVDVIIASKD